MRNLNEMESERKHSISLIKSESLPTSGSFNQKNLQPKPKRIRKSMDDNWDQFSDY